MSICDELTDRKTKLSVVGLGYVGMPIAVEFAKHVDVVGLVFRRCELEIPVR